ncbi:MAG: IS200/IS605 family transposase [Muribaculaceae bacterium]|nr:IS200/IS605 family transposase [Muribaculaceae bacterium]
MANTFVKNDVHIIFHTKAKTTNVLAEDLVRLHKYIGGIVKGLGAVLIEVGGMPDHVHLLCSLPKTMALSDFVRAVKAESSRWIKTINSHYYGAFAWQDGYGAFSVSASVVTKTIEYIRNQQEHHKVKSFLDEYKSFLKAYGMEYDERYL